MIAPDERQQHEEAWLLLPWLANGRLPHAEREWVEAHVRHCAACEEELALQDRMCGAFSEPDRVTYAPGPSFRKLMERIDEADAQRTGARKGGSRHPGGLDRDRQARSSARLARVSLWRPPGLAWAASFLVLFGVTGMLATAYRWSEPVYKTLTDPKPAAADVLHILFDRSLTIGEVEEMLRTNGARVVEGPSSIGIFGIAPAETVSGRSNAALASQQKQALAARLSTNPRVRWVEPVTQDPTPANERAPAIREP